MLAGFPNPKMAELINTAIDDGLQTPGAEEVTAKYRTGPRLVTLDGATYLRPTIVRCDSLAASAGNSRVPLSVRQRSGGAAVRNRCNQLDRRWSSLPSQRTNA